MNVNNKTNPAFPTLGEAVKLIFDVSGLLPQKNCHSNVLNSDTRKKSIQTKLRRLANEEGNLDSSLADLMHDLRALLYEAVGDAQLVQVFGDVLFDLYHSLQKNRNTEHTYFSKTNTVKWMLDCWLPGLAINSIQMHAMATGLSYSKLNFPHTKDWWLPIYGDKTVLPLERAWRWIYEETNTSQSRFHNPNNDDGFALQNYENSLRWFHNNQLPSWSTLQKNLSDSISLLSNCSDDKYQRRINSDLAHSFKVVLLISRMMTDISLRIESTYGNTYAKGLTQYVRAQHRRLVKPHKAAHQVFKLKSKHVQFVGDSLEVQHWRNETALYWDWHKQKQICDAQALQKIIDNTEGPLSTNEVKALLKKYDPAFISAFLRQSNYAPAAKELSYFNLYMVGKKLIKKDELSKDDINSYQVSIDECHSNSSLAWMVEWLMATHQRKQDKHAQAFLHYKNAFELSKGSIGQDTSKLVNQFATSCAKTNKKMEFKKLLMWAHHNNIKLRLFGVPSKSAHEVNGIFKVFKKAQFI